MVTHLPLPGLPQCMRPLESRGPAISPAAYNANDTDPEQSYPLSRKRPWPPPHLYGVRAIALPASMIFSTSVGASSGGGAAPFAGAVALWVPPLIALGVFLRESVPEAASVGLGVAGSLAMPPLLSSAGAPLATWPATGSTSFGCDFGSGGCSACFSAWRRERAGLSGPQPARTGTASRRISARRTRSSSSSPRLPWSARYVGGRCGPRWDRRA